jgi:hypothetical protein
MSHFFGKTKRANSVREAAELLAKGGQPNILEGRTLTLTTEPVTMALDTPIIALDTPTLPRPCWFQTRTWKGRQADVAGKWVIGDWEQGTLHMWGTDHEEFEMGPGMYPVGVIEDGVGFVHSISVDRIRLVKP